MGRARKGRGRPRRLRFPLREILHLKGLSQYRCAQMSGVSQQQISNICCGSKLPSWPMLLRICTSIGVDLGELTPKGGAA